MLNLLLLLIGLEELLPVLNEERNYHISHSDAEEFYHI